VEQQPGGVQQSIHQHRHQHHIRQEHSMQYSLPMPAPLPVLAPQPQMQTPDHLLDHQDNLKYFRLLDDQVPPVRSSVGRLMTGSRIGTTRVGIPQQQTLQCLSQTRTDWRMIPVAPTPSPLAFVHRQYQPQHHQHEHQHHHQHQRHNQSSVQEQGQRQRLKRSWNHMESA
jgi:hypothetical protein